MHNGEISRGEQHARAIDRTQPLRAALASAACRPDLALSLLWEAHCASPRARARAPHKDLKVRPSMCARAHPGRNGTPRRPRGRRGRTARARRALTRRPRASPWVGGGVQAGPGAGDRGTRGRLRFEYFFWLSESAGGPSSTYPCGRGDGRGRRGRGRGGRGGTPFCVPENPISARPTPSGWIVESVWSGSDGGWTGSSDSQDVVSTTHAT